MTFADNDPGDAALIAFAFNEWGDPADRPIAEVLEEHTTAEGRVLHPGDVITPRQARAERCRWHYVNDERPRWNRALSRWEVGSGPTEAPGHQ